jgi:hypothetical protein
LETTVRFIKERDNIEQVVPDSDYQPSVSQEDLIRELNLK